MVSSSNDLWTVTDAFPQTTGVVCRGPLLLWRSLDVLQWIMHECWTAMGCLFAPCVVLCITRHLLSQPNITSSSEGSSDSHGTLSEVHGNLNPNPQTSKPTTQNPTPTILCLFTGPHRRTSSWGNLYPAVVGCTQLAHIDIYSCVCLFIRHDI